MDILSWLPWVGGTTTIGLIILAVLAPSVMQVAAAWLVALTPFLKGIAEGLVEYAKSLWFGFLDMADNAKSLLFVFTLCVVAFVAGLYYSPRADCPPCKTNECPIPLPTRPSHNGQDNWLENIFPGL